MEKATEPIKKRASFIIEAENYKYLEKLRLRLAYERGHNLSLSDVVNELLVQRQTIEKKTTDIQQLINGLECLKTFVTDNKDIDMLSDHISKLSFLKEHL